MPFDNKTPAQASAAGFMLTGSDKKFESFLGKESCCVVFDLEKNKFTKGQLDELKDKKTKRVKIIVIGDGSSKEILPIADVIDRVGKVLGDEIKSKVSEFRLQVCHQGEQAKKTEEEIKKTLRQFNSRYEINFSCPKHFSDISRNPPRDTSAETLDEFSYQDKIGKVVPGETYVLSVEPFNVKPSSKPNDTNGTALKNSARRNL